MDYVSGQPLKPPLPQPITTDPTRPKPAQQSSVYSPGKKIPVAVSGMMPPNFFLFRVQLCDRDFLDLFSLLPPTEQSSLVLF
jgi:hypothetical protein